MAFQLGTISYIAKELLPKINREGKMVSLSRHHITTHPQMAKQYFESEGYDTELDGINWDNYLTSKDVFNLLGMKHYDDIDFTPDDGCNIIHDMNLPIPTQYHREYDLVFELGTMEHIFDVKTVFENINKMLKVGGTVFHMSPLDMINHGFYNFSLTIFYDVYRNNGFDSMNFFIVAFPKDCINNQKINYEKVNFKASNIDLKSLDEYSLMVSFMATKTKEIEPFQTPIQAAYDPALKINTPLKHYD